MSYKNRNILATLPRTQRGMPLVLGQDPKGKTFLYTNGNSVIIRDIADGAISDIYTEHSVATTVAKYSPSGFYIASADQSGKVRIWDTTQKEHILKASYQPICGPIKDLAWSPDNQRIVVVGEGREKFGHVFMVETGTSVGEIAGHSNLINACDFRPKRPFCIITGSEDNSVGVFEGPPFKFKMTLNDHTRFVQSVKFSPDGELFVSAGFDGKMFLYKATGYSKVGQFGDPAHGGGIYAVSWSPDGSKILSASGDKSCKIWDPANFSVIAEFKIGNDVQDQQVSCLWQGDYILSVSLSGFINFLDINNPEKPKKVIKGHNKSITALSIIPQKDELYTGSHDGMITFWNIATGEHDRIGNGHSNQVQSMAVDNDTVYSCGLDDTIRSICSLTHQYQSSDLKLDSQPRGIAVASSGKILVAGINEIALVSDGKKISSLAVDFEPSCISAHSSECDVAVGGAMDMQVHIFLLNGTTFSPKITMGHRGAITDVAYSPDGTYLAACDCNRKVVLYNALTYELSHDFDWIFHTARVNCLAWSPNSLFLASGSLDTNVIIWSTKNPSKHLIIKKAHPQSQITRVGWMSNTALITTGQDSNIKIWDIDF